MLDKVPVETLVKMLVKILPKPLQVKSSVTMGFREALVRKIRAESVIAGYYSRVAPLRSSALGLVRSRAQG